MEGTREGRRDEEKDGKEKTTWDTFNHKLTTLNFYGFLFKKILVKNLDRLIKDIEIYLYTSPSTHEWIYRW